MWARWLAAISRECRTAPNGMMPWLIPSSERYDAVAHSVIRAVELSFDELLGPTVFDPGCSVVSKFAHTRILPSCVRFGIIFGNLSLLLAWHGLCGK